jgi:hypothetical protein
MTKYIPNLPESNNKQWKRDSKGEMKKWKKE